MRQVRPVNILCAIFLACTGLNPGALARPLPPGPNSSMEWFQRASDSMNLRMPGSVPFHMKVRFHAFPGIELLLGKEKSELITGDGIYDEVWLAPHEWRREVSLASYHAIEVDSNGVRKMQASSDHEPSRVLMLLSAVLDPIPRNFSSKEFRHEGASGWEIAHLSSHESSLVRINNSFDWKGYSITDAFYFLPTGVLAKRNYRGFATSWLDDVVFAGKIVPERITLKAGDRELVTASVDIERAPSIDRASFDLTVERAEPGFTLRPLQRYELKFGEDAGAIPAGEGNEHGAFTLYGVLDRNGKYREMELILLLGEESNLPKLMEDLRNRRWGRAEFDGSPCEFLKAHTYLSIINRAQS